MIKKEKMKIIYYYPIRNQFINNNDSIQVKLNQCGANTGNLVWVNAVKNNIGYDLQKDDLINWEDHCHYIFAMANDINVYQNTLLRLGNYVEHLSDYEVTILGLGAQYCLSVI